MSDLSEWEVVDSNVPQKARKSSGDLAEWSVVPITPPSEQSSNETFGQSALKAIPRIGEDLYKRAAGFVKNAPDYWNQAKTEVPGALNPKEFWSHPGHSALQGLAGSQEAINTLAQFPATLADYAENRLNLLPKGSADFARKYLVPEDTTQAINQLFDKPKYPGEALQRGAFRHLPDVVPARALNPMRLTEKGIANTVERATNREINKHERQYNNLFRDAERAGINDVPVSSHLIESNLDFIRPYKSPRDYRSVENFNAHPTLQNAQSAASDLKKIMRSLDEKSKTSSLTEEERHMYHAAENTMNHIEQNMFLNPDGTVNEAFANRHRGINTSYRENVVPYRYNKAIQDYLDEQITPTELVNSLSKGAFAVKKGGKHPAIKIRNALPKAVLGAGSLGGLGWLGKQLFGGSQAEQ